MKKKFYIFSPCFYMLLSMLAGEAASMIFGFSPRLAYSVFSAVVPLFVYSKCGGEKIRFSSEGITYKILLTAVFLWAGGNLLNSAVNVGLEKIGIMPFSQLEPETDAYHVSMNVICACIAAPICEEIVYRGIVLKSAYPCGKETAIFISALLFALAHGSVTLFAMPFVYGIICGAIAVKTKSVVPGMLIHCLCNTMSYIFTKSDFTNAALLTAILGSIYIIYLIVSAVKNAAAVKRAVSGFQYSIDFWWIPVLIKTILSNIL